MKLRNNSSLHKIFYSLILGFHRRQVIDNIRQNVGKKQFNAKAELNDPVEEKSLYTDTPVVHKYLKEMNAVTFGQDPDSVTVGEMSSTTIANSIEYSKPSEHELSMVFTFHHLKVDYKDGEKWSKMPFDFMKLKELFTEWQEKMDQGGGWNALFWNNHDQPWALNRFGNTGKYREKSAEMLATATHLMREEIGMMDPDYSSMNDYVDVEAKNAFKELTAKGMSEKDAFEIIKTKARDNSRVPMHWDDSQYAGFSDVKPWLMPTDQNQVNVEKELASGEIFDYYQKLIKLRKNEKLISDGHIKMFLKDHPQVFAYERFLDNSDKKLLVFTNFYGKECQAKLPKEYVNKNYQVLISNYEHNSNQFKQEIILKPYEALAVVI
uniref:alpha-amylase family glycosyl hydrolase n=1 Tax=Lactobacillus helveticus TaxID=1587 RepID=UPI00283A8CC4|nr:alpha-amylase family glycosyl hydrolase [Lactobacillus helveticus]